jgi:hypothetical protein
MGEELAAKAKDRKETHVRDRKIWATSVKMGKSRQAHALHLPHMNRVAWRGGRHPSLPTREKGKLTGMPG